MDSVVTAAMIGTGGTIFASLVGAAIAGWYGKRWLKQEKLIKQLERAIADVEFILEVEKIYIENSKDLETVPNKNAVRDEVRKRGFVWSAQNTPGRVRSGSNGR